MSAPVVLIPENPMPEGGQVRWMTMPDGARLRVFTWAGGHRGTVFLFNGRTEFVEKYFEVVGELRARGFAVVSLDWRGQGLSTRLLADPRKGHIDDFSTFDRDLAQVMAEVAPGFPKPWFALAHSMGGNILMRAAHDHPDWFAGVVLSAPMLGLNFPGKAMALAVRGLAVGLDRLGLGARYLPGGTPKANDETPFAENILTHDERRYALLQALTRAEPGLGLGSATVGWLHAAFRSVDTVSAPGWLAEVETPVLICLAAQDSLIDGAALRHAAVHLPGGELVEIAGARHEILIEIDACRAAFWGAFDAFTGKLEKS
ncbi:MAG: alpha/beta hydrolase [Parvibaculum sp.]|uniref:alpha/beta fold hydrolase n=1 Tax=Parvibaculum sp. TaxID=2024848 RepID=UPI002726A5FF|nr:alpha/beta hydrolase [Parvibaculum sp.]MDO8838091.1 alpha/beta hydrolase [Parvibaculum sp.]